MTTEKAETLREIIAWCEQVAAKQWDVYRAASGNERVRAGAAGDAYWSVAGYCREMLEQPTQGEAK